MRSYVFMLLLRSGIGFFTVSSNGITELFPSTYRLASNIESIIPFSARGSEYPIIVENEGSCNNPDYIACFATNTSNKVLVGNLAYPSNILQNGCNVYLVPCSMTSFNELYEFRASIGNTVFNLNISSLTNNVQNDVFMPANVLNPTNNFINNIKSTSTISLSPPPMNPPNPPAHPPSPLPPFSPTSFAISSIIELPGLQFNSTTSSSITTSISSNLTQYSSYDNIVLTLFQVTQYSIEVPISISNENLISFINSTICNERPGCSVSIANRRRLQFRVRTIRPRNSITVEVIERNPDTIIYLELDANTLHSGLGLAPNENITVSHSHSLQIYIDGIQSGSTTGTLPNINITKQNIANALFVNINDIAEIQTPTIVTPPNPPPSPPPSPPSPPTPSSPPQPPPPSVPPPSPPSPPAPPSSPSESTLQIQMYPGWNWVSFNNIPNDNTPQSFFNQTNLNDNDQITSQIDGSLLHYSNAWYGSLTSIDSHNMYMIKIGNPSGMTINIIGTPHSFPYNITLVAGYNWIAYPYSETRTKQELFDTLYPNNIITNIISQRDGNYPGTLDTFRPGYGYIFRVDNTATLSFT